jgi:hypothetical protein
LVIGRSDSPSTGHELWRDRNGGPQNAIKPPDLAIGALLRAGLGRKLAATRVG